MNFFPTKEEIKDRETSRLRDTADDLKYTLEYLRHRCYDVVAEAEAGKRTHVSAIQMLQSLESKIADVEQRRNILEGLVRADFSTVIELSRCGRCIRAYIRLACFRYLVSTLFTNGRKQLDKPSNL